jgi:YidC/Oxa1 family membrane protein insertase
MIYSLLLAKGGYFDPIAKPLAAVLAFFYDVIPNYGIAIVLLTVAMMVVLTPLTIKQTRSMLVMQKLQPEMKKLQEKHKNDRQALNEAVMALYKEHNASPLGGCLPMLLPFPLFIALLRLLEGLSHIDGTTHKAMPKYLSHNTRMYHDIVAAKGQLDAFGMNLAKSARNVGGGFGHALPYFVLLLLMVATQFYQQYQLTSKNPAAKSQPGQAAMMKFIPLFFGLISIQFAAGVVLYWTVSNLIRVGSQWAQYEYDPKVKALVAQDVDEIEAKTREIDAKGSPKTPKAKSGGLFRNILASATEAAEERRNQGGKSAAKPKGAPPSGKGITPPRGARPQSGKATGGTPNAAKGQRPRPTQAGKPSGPQKGTPQKAGAQKAGAQRPGAAKPGSPQKGATPPKGGPPQKVGQPKAGTPTTASGTPKAGAPQSASPSAKAGAPQNASAAPKGSTPPSGASPPKAGNTQGASDAPNAGEPNAGQPNAGQPNAAATNAGQPNAGQPNAGATNAAATNAGATNDAAAQQVAPADGRAATHDGPVPAPGSGTPLPEATTSAGDIGPHATPKGDLGADAKPANTSNGATKSPAAADSNGAPTSEGDGTPARAGAGNGPPAGRTGGGSPRNLSNRRRRKGR